MARTYKRKTDRRSAGERKLSARVVRRTPVDGHAVTRIYSEVMQAQIEAEAKAAHETTTDRSGEGGTK